MSFQHTHGSGFQFVEQFLLPFKNSPLSMIASSFEHCFRLLFSDVFVDDALKVFSEMERLFEALALQDRNSSERLPVDKDKELCNCLVLFYRTLFLYHKKCAEELNTALMFLLSQNALPTYFHEKLQDLQNDTGKEIPQAHGKNNKKKLSTSKESPKLSPKTSPKQVLKESFFSLFERKASAEGENRSSFYVSTPVGPTSAETIDIGAGSPNTVKDEKNNIDNDTCSYSTVQSGGGGVETNSIVHLQDSEHDNSLLSPSGCHLASEEELDSVINLLSGFGSFAPKMQSIPEGSITIPVPPLSSNNTQPVKTGITEATVLQATDINRNLQYPVFDVPANMAGNNNLGRNTWPSQHRASLPAGSFMFPPAPFEGAQQQVGYPGNNSGVGRRYSHDLRYASQQLLPPPPPPPPFNVVPQAGSGNLVSNVNWSYSDAKLNKTWPSSYVPQKSMDIPNQTSNWLGAHDSSEGSDDSSGGDQQCFAVGLDLVHALDSKDNSSDEDFSKRGVGTSGSEVKHRSMEDLLDSRGLNTWSSKQPWSQVCVPGYPANCGDSTQISSPIHKPLQMQWSDPMSSRNVWPKGLGQPSLPNSQSAQSFSPSH